MELNHMEVIGGAPRGKAILMLNSSDPPMVMRNTVYIIPEPAAVDEEEAQKTMPGNPVGVWSQLRGLAA